MKLEAVIVTILAAGLVAAWCAFAPAGAQPPF